MKGLVSIVYRSRRTPINKLATHDLCRVTPSKLKSKLPCTKSCGAAAASANRLVNRNLPVKERMRGIAVEIEGVCAKCHKSAVRKDHLFCGNCGMRQIRLGDVSQPPEMLATALVVPYGECEKCHRRVLSEHNFCPWCGAMLVRKSIVTGKVIRKGMVTLRCQTY